MSNILFSPFFWLYINQLFFISVSGTPHEVPI
nr:MAG TPA: hypothetical protein [Caudoviricetes sp.]